VLGDLQVTKVGERNAEFVREFLQREDIPIQAHDLCGPYPRKVYFFPDNGAVKIKLMKRLHNETILRRESEYAKHLREAPVAGEVELF
jgi:chemotaxis protein CheD